MNPASGARFAAGVGRALLSGLLDLAWPVVCPLCGEELETGARGTVTGGCSAPRALAHERCVADLPRLGRGGVMPVPLSRTVPVLAWLRDTPELFDLLHRAKYGGEPSLLDALSAAWALELKARSRPGRAVLVPLPDDADRRRARGYGVTERLARGLSSASGWRVDTRLLRRRRPSPPQARQSDDAARRRNVEGCFAVGDLSRVPDRCSLLLVEDQVTSGATVREAVGVLGVRGHPIAILALAASARAPRGVGP